MFINKIKLLAFIVTFASLSCFGPTDTDSIITKDQFDRMRQTDQAQLITEHICTELELKIIGV